ncbi:hypothetical protein [Loktanella sp. S4079]|uniref:hypothetical protein n=1 Tax=Loktanella sp. S4079 TaxID=579483 RepID=UPI0012ECBC17|nr:hypothetical protein [Loktanella sp. S4079]
MSRYLLQTVSLLAGLILFSIGIVGLGGLSVVPSPTVTMLLTPLGYGALVDNVYYWIMLFLGVWLVVAFYVRPAAFTALTLVVGKSAILKGWLPLVGIAFA